MYITYSDRIMVSALYKYIKDTLLIYDAVRLRVVIIYCTHCTVN